jgi:hypothetical protein
MGEKQGGCAMTAGYQRKSVWVALLYIAALMAGCAAEGSALEDGEDPIEQAQATGESDGIENGGDDSASNPITEQEKEDEEIEEEVTPPTNEPPLEVPRILLHEAFSGSNCKPCNQADKNLEEILSQNPGLFTIIKYQVGSDPYVSQEAVKRRMYYLPGKSTYDVPFVHADGVNGFHPLKANNDQGYLQSEFENWQSISSELVLQVVSSTEGQTVSLDIGITPLADYDAGMILHAAIFESVTYNNVGTNGQTEFHYVMKKMVPHQYGTPLDELVRGESRVITLQHTFVGDYNPDTSMQKMVKHNIEHTVEDFNNLYVIVWIQAEMDWQVEQSAWNYPEK